jgi:23S rRNA pseudouridine2605 synthase
MSPEARNVRIHKYLAAHGLASRRSVERMLEDGRITVNGKVPRKIPCFVDPEVDKIRVDGRLISRREAKKVYFLLNKPKGVVCSQRDRAGRPRAIDLIPPIKQRVYCVGRLDADSTGLILLTNDGELTQQLTHPSYGISKRYIVEIAGRLTAQDRQKLRKGTYLDGTRTQGPMVRVLRGGPEQSLLSITLREGRNREIRRILARTGCKVRRLKRVTIGPITDRGLKVGKFRMLSPVEVRKVKRIAMKPGDRPPKRDKR